MHIGHLPGQNLFLKIKDKKSFFINQKYKIAIKLLQKINSLDFFFIILHN